MVRLKILSEVREYTPAELLDLYHVAVDRGEIVPSGEIDLSRAIEELERAKLIERVPDEKPDAT
jgi:hypothetical protein